LTLTKTISMFCNQILDNVEFIAPESVGLPVNSASLVTLLDQIDRVWCLVFPWESKDVNVHRLGIVVCDGVMGQ
jgi:hypothetical protein